MTKGTRDGEEEVHSGAGHPDNRERLGISAKDYAKLVGVTMLTIYNWEKGKGKPRAKALAAWANVRGIGKREALKRLELLGA